MPLELAARAIYRRVYEDAHRKAGVACNTEHLNGIAYAIAGMLPLFVVDDSTSRPRAVESGELVRGLFREGGRRLIFLDERPALSCLAVSAARLEDVVRALLGQGT
jgi:hypothetical protein